MSRRVLILTGSSLCHNPRAFKEAMALASAGYCVEVLGAWIDPELKARDAALLKGAAFKFTPVLDATRDHWRWMRSRVVSKAARIWQDRTGMETRWQLGYAVGGLVRAARRRKADLVIAHLEPALWAASRLAAQRRRESSFRIGVDMEDWYSEDLPPEARKHRPIRLLRRLEGELLRQASHVTCPSRAMSQALAKEYGCRPPAVVYNAFPWADRDHIDGQFKDRRDRSVPSLHWYSQTIGHDRGLEELVAALPDVRHAAEIHLRGRCAGGFREWLQKHLPDSWRSRVFIHDLVSNDELLSRIVEHDIGLAGETKICRSRDLTVTNKVLHYLLGGLAVVASDTAGQREIAEQAGGAVRLYPSGDSLALAARLNELLASAEELQSAKAAALKAAEQTFCWERQSRTLIRSVDAALATPIGARVLPADYSLNLTGGDAG